MVVAVVLSGCGVYDGTEVHEASAICVALSRLGQEVVFYAPDAPQHHSVNHISGAAADDQARNCRVESARIARGKVESLADLTAESVDAVIFPGGFGAAKNLCTFGVSEEPTVDEEVARVVRDFRDAGKPIGMCCIAPVILALVLAKEDGHPIKITLGKEGEGWPYGSTLAKAIEMGATVEECEVNEVCVDAENKIVTSPAFMFSGKFHEIFDGIQLFVQEVVALI